MSCAGIVEQRLLTARRACSGQQILALSTAGSHEFAALLVARLFKMLILPELLRKTFLLTRLLESAEKFFHVLASPAFHSDHAELPRFPEKG